MVTYSFSLVVTGLDLDDLDALDRLLAAAEPVTVGEHHGQVAVAFERDGANAEDAVCSAISAIESALPAVTVIALDDDLVSIPDIADRTGRGRESVRLLVEGKRGPGGFPAPLGVVGDGIRVWSWGDVNTWLRDRLGEGDDVASPAADVRAAVAGALAQRRLGGELVAQRIRRRLPSGLGDAAKWRATGTVEVPVHVERTGPRRRVKYVSDDARFTIAPVRRAG